MLLNIRIDVHHHGLHCGDDNDTRKLLEKIMHTQKEIADGLVAIKDQLVKANAELQGKLAALAEAIKNSPVTDELKAAFEGVKVAAQGLDDIVPDEPAPTPTP